jgi:hypothetical protein
MCGEWRNKKKKSRERKWLSSAWEDWQQKKIDFPKTYILMDGDVINYIRMIFEETNGRVFFIFEIIFEMFNYAEIILLRFTIEIKN